MKLLALSALIAGLPACATVVSHYRFEPGHADEVVDNVDGSVDGAQNGTLDSSVPVNPIPLTGDPNLASLSVADGSKALITSPFIFHAAYGDATLEFWLKATDQSHHSIFWTRGDDSDANRFNIAINPGGQLSFDYREPNATLHELLGPGSSFIIPPGVWTHVAVTRTVDSPTSHTYRFYKDGALITSEVDANPNPPTADSWQISGRGGFPFTGLIDEVRFSDTALPPEQFLNGGAGLEIHRLAGEAVISWPAAWVDWKLESTSSVTSGDWHPRAEIPAMVDGRLEVHVPATETAEFFRLRRPEGGG